MKKYGTRYCVTGLVEPHEYIAVKDAARRAKLPVALWIRAVVVDALYEEGYDFSQCSRSAGGTPVGESFETGRGPAS